MTQLTNVVLGFVLFTCRPLHSPHRLILQSFKSGRTDRVRNHP